MRRTARPSQILNTLHKGFVWACIGLTGYGFYIGGTAVYHYLTVTRPRRLALKEDLLKEDVPQSPSLEA